MSEHMRILVIDDEPIVCSSCERVLRDEGHEVDTVSSGADGLNLLRQTEYDLVITDIKMPVVSGMEILDY